MLVSVIVATYNCASFIEDALDSVYRQTYKDIELIVTDDCSHDDSVSFATHWIENHKERFVHIVQTQTSKNSGVTANYNAGLKEARGEWIKCLDGDDILPDDAIATYVEHCTMQPEITVWYAHEKAFTGNSGWYSDRIRSSSGALDTYNKNQNNSTLPSASPRKQMIFLLNHRLLGICTATNFINRESFVAQGGFDSRYPMYQDGSPFLQALADNKSVGIIDKVLLYKRENPDSLMHTANLIMVQNIRDCHYHYCRFYLKYGMFLHYYNAFVTHWLASHDTRWYAGRIRSSSGALDACGLTLIKLTGYILRCFDIVNVVNKLRIKNSGHTSQIAR